MTAFFDVTGSGPAVVFLHAAMADRRMWQPQWQHFAATNTVLRFDMRGFGDNVPTTEPYSNAHDVLAAMDQAGIAKATFVGNSMGARVALEIALTQPERVTGLVLIGPGMASHIWSQATRDLWQSEAAALDTGDVDAAVGVNLDYWLDGPDRQRANLTTDQRDLVANMQRRAFELELDHPDAADEVRLADFDERIHEVAVPTRVLYGTEDATDIAAIAHRLAELIATATLHPIEDTGHLPSFEAPGECNEHIAAVLAAAAG